MIPLCQECGKQLEFLVTASNDTFLACPGCKVIARGAADSDWASVSIANGGLVLSDERDEEDGK